jgi:hypothetical protein
LTILLFVVSLIATLFVPAVQDWVKSFFQSQKSSSSAQAIGTTPTVAQLPISTSTARTQPPSTPTGKAANNDTGAAGPGVGAAGKVPQQTAPTSEYLSDLDPIEGDNRVKVATLENNGLQTTYAHGLRTQKALTEYTFEYNIAGGFQYFHATIGIDITAPSGSTVEFEVYLDGSSVGDYTLGTNTTQDIQIPVTGHGQVKLYTTLVHNAGESAAAVWGNAEYTND